MNFRLPALMLLALGALALADDLPTLMTTRGALLVEQNFEAPLPPYDGSNNPGNSFASGFKGWRYNTVVRGGTWSVVDGTFVGTENPAVSHPATACYGFDFKNVVIQCEVQMIDAPLEGRRLRFVDVRTCDTKDYVCRVHLQETGFSIEKSDNDHAGPDKAVPLGDVKTPLALGAWHSVVLEIFGEEMVATVDGRSLTGTHPLLATDKKSVMFVAGVVSAVRHFKAWEARPNPEWPARKAALAAGQPENPPKAK